MATTKPVVVFLAFANDRDDKVGEGYLRNLPDEARRLREVLQPAEQAGLCEVVVRGNSTAGDIFGVFQDPQYRNRIAIFHYGGHANGYQLALEAASGAVAAADAAGLARFFAQQQGLQLVFLNGCSTAQQTHDLLDANIPAVISTSRPIDDRIATNFAHQFYQGLAGGASLRTAYNEAEASVQTTEGGGSHRGGFGDRKSQAAKRELAERIPWKLHLSEGAESADQWNLPQAVGDPLFGLPPLPQQDLPESPYRHLNWFTRKDAEVFFGRGHQIRELYDRLTAPGTPPIMLFYGQSGVGKSSILDAGLIPRLEKDYEVRYERRTADGLLATLQRVFSCEASEPEQTQNSQQAGKPVVEFLDQVEELYTRPAADVPSVHKQLVRVLKTIFSEPKRYLDKKAEGLLQALRQPFMPPANETPLAIAWRKREEQTGKPLIVFLDQVEELYTRPSAAVPNELEDFLLALKDIFADSNQRPKGKLVLGFRKEWLAELEAELVEHKLPRTKVFLEPLNRNGIIEVVRGPTQSQRLREKYGLTVEQDLPEIIADDLMEDRDSAVAPTLQILLTKLWIKATEQNGEKPLFSLALYQELKRDGILMRDFLNQQIAKFRARSPEVVDSGLLIDILALHTTALGTAGQCSLADLQLHYQHIDKGLSDLLQQCQDLYLLTVAAGAQKESNKTTRLAHDTLAPLVRERFDESDLPGQRARRILDNRSVDWAGTQVGTPLDEADLDIVEQGLGGTRSLSKTEQRLLQASRDQRVKLQQDRQRNKIFRYVAVALIAIAGVVGWIQWDLANKAKRTALIQVGNAAWKEAVSARDSDHDDIRAAHLLVSAAAAFAGAGEPQRARNSLIAINEDVVATFPHEGSVTGALFNDDESRVLSWSADGTVVLWDVEKDYMPLKIFKHDGFVLGAMFNGKESMVLSWDAVYSDDGVGDGTVMLWDVKKDDKPLKMFNQDGYVFGAMFNGNESMVLSWGADDTVRLWDIQQDDKSLKIFKHDGTIEGAMFNGKESMVLSWSDDDKVLLWDIEKDDKPRKRFELDGSVKGAMFNGNESMVLSWDAMYSGDGGTVMLWDVEKDDKPLKTFKHNERVTGATFNADGTMVLSWSWNGTVWLWDIEQDNKPLKMFKHDGSVEGAMFNSKESMVLSWGRDGTVWLWDIEQGNKPLKMFKHDGLVEGAMFNGKGSMVLSWSKDGTVRLWDIQQDNKPLKMFKHDGSVEGAMFNGKESMVLSWSKDRTVRLWDMTPDGGPLKTFEYNRIVRGAHDGLIHAWLNDADSKLRRTDRIEEVGDAILLRDIVDFDKEHRPRPFGQILEEELFNRDETMMLSWGLGKEGRIVRLWDLKQVDKPPKTFKHNDVVTGATLNADGTMVLSWGWDGTVWLWDIEQDNKPLKMFENDGQIYGATFYDASRVLSWSEDDKVRLWDIEQDDKAPKIFKANGAVAGVTINDDASRVLIWGSLEGVGFVWIWDPKQVDKPPKTFKHNESVTGAAFNADGTLVLSWSSNGTVWLWDIEQDNGLLRTFGHDNNAMRAIAGAMFSGDQSRVLSWHDKTVRLWDIEQDDRPLKTFDHHEAVIGAMFNGDESQVLSWSKDNRVQFWDIPRFDVSTKSIATIKRELEVRTAATITERGVVRILKVDELLEKRKQMHDDNPTTD